jgi:hypothetical protein
MHRVRNPLRVFLKFEGLAKGDNEPNFSKSVRYTFTFVRLLNLKIFIMLGEGTPLRLFLDSLGLASNYHTFNIKLCDG